MSGDVMEFPETVEEFMDDYKVVDSEGIYMSKGAELVPIFRMNQWFEHESNERDNKCKICRYSSVEIRRKAWYKGYMFGLEAAVDLRTKKAEEKIEKMRLEAFKELNGIK